MKLKAFHAYDIRGHFGADLTVDIAYKVAYFLPELLDTRRVLIGRDMRLSSPALHDAVIKGLLDAGAEVCSGRRYRSAVDLDRAAARFFSAADTCTVFLACR